MKRIVLCLIICCVSFIPMFCNATIVAFENFAPTGGLINVNPGMPYFESGFKIATTRIYSGVFDSGNIGKMPGNNTDFFGFESSNTPTLTTTTAGGRFDLQSVLIGPLTYSSNLIVDMTITGHIFGGGTVSQSFTGITTATTASLSWTNLASVDFTTTDDAGLDEINVSVVPEPCGAILTLLALPLMGAFTRRAQK